MGTLRSFIDTREKEVSKKTINLALGVVRHILNLAAEEWRDEMGLTWLDRAPKIKLLKVDDAREPYPLDRREERHLMSCLPRHLAEMALFAVNTGCREQDVCQLRWQWEIKIPQLGTSVFLLPGDVVKNEEDRLVVLNRVASSIIESQRDQHPDYVFVNREPR